MRTRSPETLTLPWPPSVNHVWRRAIIGGRPTTLLSREGRRFRSAVVLAALQQRRGPPWEGRLKVLAAAVPPDRKRRDLDNLLKATLDALTRAGVWLDDGQIDQLTVERRAPEKGRARLEVTIEELAG